MDRQIDRFLLDYFNKNLKKGYDIEALKITLLQQGYLRTSVDRAVAIIKEKSKKEKEERELEEKKKKQVVEIVEEPVEKKGFFRRLFGG